MYQKVLVPLDGSELAECVLPHVEDLVSGGQVKDIIFLRVIEPYGLTSLGLTVPEADMVMPTPTPFSVQFAEQRKRIESEARVASQAYLSQVVSRLKHQGVNLKTAVLPGKAAETIADYASKNGIDLIVIATHGRSGVSRWVWGSVADRVLRSACVPVLMVRAPGCIPGIL
jgi:nucleotide-binding universal stress UspA family protein